MQGLLELISASPTAFHAAGYIENKLIEKGFTKLSENQKWDLEAGRNYFITRNNSSVIAFKLPKGIYNASFNITAAHLDSPTFKIKPNFTLDKGKYTMLNTEVYGGPILNTWMDRPLNIAGRVIYKDSLGLKTKLVSFDKPMAIIPNCSIHYYPELNKGVQLNPQNDLVPLFSDNNINKTDLLELVSKKININMEDIVSHDLYLSVLDRGVIGGANNEFIMAPQIDNLECSYACLEAFLKASPKLSSINVLALFDNEEIGSRTRQGAASTMLSDVLERISSSLQRTQEEHKMALANSFIVSADNAHGYHPNYPAKYDPTNAVYLNRGIVIKNASRGSYTTDAVSLAYFKTICKNARARYQLNTNRSDIPGGSTLGIVSLSNVSIHSVDIGLAQLAMHSAYETAGVYDLVDMIKALEEFYSMHLEVNQDGELTF